MAKFVEAKIDSAELAIFKKKLKKLAEFKGSGTQLISLYLPEKVDRSSVMNQLNTELGQSSNIKSPQTRKAVQGALRRISTFLKQIDFKLPKNGLVVFCGNISSTPGRSDIRLFTVRPLKDLKLKLYWCDSEFHLAPLKEMIAPQDIYGLLTIDKREATIAVLKGKRYEIVGTFSSQVAGKIRAGGQCCAPETLIQKSDGDIVKIQELHNSAALSSFDFNSKAMSTSSIIDHWQASKDSSLKIITKNPRLEINCSTDHVLFVAENGFKEKAAKELKKGDYLIMPEEIKVNGVEQKLGSIECFNSFIISKKGRAFLKRKRLDSGLYQSQLAKKTGLSQAGISCIELGKSNVRVSILRKICLTLGISFQSFLENFAKPDSNISLPSTLNKKLAQSLGYLIGDGNIGKERICFSEQDKELANYYFKKLKRFFNAHGSMKFRKEKGYHQLRIYGKPLVRLIQKEFPEISKAKTSLLPKKVLMSKNEIVTAFLRGLFDAEGYVAKNQKLGIGMNNKLLIQQTQLLLLRFGIISSFLEYDNRANQYSNNPRFTLEISEKQSLKLFKEKIGFSSSAKRQKLNDIINKKSDTSYVRQVISSGKEVRKLIEDAGFNLELFPKVNNFFRNERQISKQVFQKSILSNITDQQLRQKLKELAKIPLLRVKINHIESLKNKTSMTDISVKNKNFIANGLIVHNSAQRFARLREEAEHDFYKRISEKMNMTFAEMGDKLKGLIIGGPGSTKNAFLGTELLDHRLKNKVIATVDASYTDESGIREIVMKSEEILKDTDLMKERAVLDEFMTEVAKDRLAAYGQKEVEEALETGKVKTLLLSEAIDWLVFKFKCVACGNEEIRVVKEPDKFEAGKEKCSRCNSPLELLEEVDYADYLLEKAQATGAATKIISTESAEGEQFFKGFGGIGALLRYK